MTQAAHSRFGFMSHLQMLLQSAGMTTLCLSQCFDLIAKGREPEVHFSRKEREIQASLGTYWVKTVLSLCCKALQQENTTVQSHFCFMLRMTQLQQPRRDGLKEYLPLSEMIR